MMAACLIERLTCQALDGEAFELAALAPDLASPLARQRLQVVRERAVAAVAPVELERVAHREPVFREVGEIPFREESACDELTPSSSARSPAASSRARVTAAPRPHRGARGASGPLRG